LPQRTTQRSVPFLAVLARISKGCTMFELQLFGGLELRDADRQSLQSLLAQPKRIAVLAYLATRGGFVRRDLLLPLFWPEQDQEHGRASLRKVVHLLRRSLCHDAIVSRGDEELGVNPGRLRCDVLEFRQALERGEAERAVALYQGELLPGFFLDEVPDFERWLDAEREKFRNEAAHALDLLTEAAEARGEAEQAILWARRRLELTPGDEAALRRVLCLCERTGDRAGALSAYEHFCVQLRLAYDLEPSAETRALIDRLRAPAAVIVAPAPPPEEPPARPQPLRLAPAGGSALASLPFGAGSVSHGHGLAWISVHRWLPALVAIALLISGFVVAGQPMVRSVRGALAGATRSESSIAVLPIADLGTDARAQYLGDGMTDELINTLSLVPGLRVSSRTSSFAMKNSGLDVQEIGQRLGVKYVLEGSLRRDGDRLRLSVRLIDTSTGERRWGEVYDRQASNALSIQNEISREVSRALRGPLAVRAPGQVVAATRSSEAYDDYLRGRFLMMQRRNLESVDAAIRYFSEALEKDSLYAQSYAGLAEAYLTKAEYVSPKTVLPRAKAAAVRALELNDNLPETHLALAKLLLHSDWNWTEAEREYLRAIELAPDLAIAHYGYADFLRASRRFDEMLREVRAGLAIERTETVDPIAFARSEQLRLGRAMFQAQRYDEAITHHRMALELDPTAQPARSGMAYALYMKGEYGHAAAMMDTIRATGGSPALEMMGAIYARAGRRAEAMEMLQRLLAESRTRYVPKDQIGGIYNGLGDVDNALRWFEAAVDDHHWLAVYRNSDPLVESLRSNPRFQRLLRQMNAPA
jgi:TolB-like protein/DNA-binding SARP family transcriptional activator/tetratricopeptide (TPR) repeat protein